MSLAYAPGTAIPLAHLPDDVAAQLPPSLLPRLRWMRGVSALLLPSGLWVVVRVRDLAHSLGRAGLSDEQLRGIIELEIGHVRGRPPDDAQRNPTARVERGLQHVRLQPIIYDAWTRLCLVWPEAVDDPALADEHHLYLPDLDDADKAAIMRWAKGGTAADDAVAFPDAHNGSAGEEALPAPGGVGPVRDDAGDRPARQRARRAAG